MFTFSLSFSYQISSYFLLFLFYFYFIIFLFLFLFFLIKRNKSLELETNRPNGKILLFIILFYYYYLLNLFILSLLKVITLSKLPRKLFYQFNRKTSSIWIENPQERSAFESVSNNVRMNGILSWLMLKKTLNYNVE